MNESWYTIEKHNGKYIVWFNQEKHNKDGRGGGGVLGI